MSAPGRGSTRGIALVLVIVLAVTVAGCAGVVTAAAGDGSEEPGTVDESADGGSSESDTEDDANAPESNAPEGTLEIHAIDVEQGDATLLVGPEETMLIDSGDWRDDGETVIAYLESQGIERIDYLVTTHAHADHIGGHAAVIEHYETERDGVGEVWDPGVSSTSGTYENYLDAVEEHDVDLVRAQSGDEIDFAGGTTVLNPPEEHENDDLNGNSLSVRVTHGETAFLATGDAESETEERMVEEHGDALEADVYQAGHHGSSTSSSDQFLDQVDPEYAIVSSAYDSQYGHPHDEVLAAFADRGIETYWTAVHGSIILESDGEELSVETASDATSDPAELRDEPPADVDEAETAIRTTAIDAQASIHGSKAIV